MADQGELAMLSDTFIEQAQFDAVRTMIEGATTPMVLCRQGQVVAVSHGWLALSGMNPAGPCSIEALEQRCKIKGQPLLRLQAAAVPRQLELELTASQGELRICTVQLNRFELNRVDQLNCFIFTDNTAAYRSEQALGQIVATASADRGARFFDRLTRTLCETLGHDLAVIARLNPENNAELQALSIFLDGQHQPSMTFAVPGSPCEQVIRSGEPRHYPAFLGTLFPEHLFLKVQAMESYLGFPLEDNDGAVSGVIMLLSREQMMMPEGLISMLRFVAQRVESDLQRQQVEERLTVSNLGLNVAERLAGMGSWVVDVKRQSVLISEQMARLYALESFHREVPRSMTMQRVHPDDRARVRQAIADGEKSGRPYTFQHRIQRPDGSTRWIRSGCEPVTVDGRLVRILGVSQDITELTHSQRQAFESEQMQRRLIAACPYGITHLDHKLRFVYVNKIAEQIYGYSLDQLQGRSLRDVLPPAQWQETGAMYDELLGTPAHVTRYQRQGMRPDGELRQLDVTLNYLLDEEGNTQGFIGFLTDITERIADEVRLRQLSTIVEQSPSSILITNVEGEIEYINPAFEATSGYSTADIVGQTPRVLRSGKTAPQVYEQMWRTITQGEPWRGELLNRRKDGSLFWELASLAPIRSPEGEITHYVSINEDITRLKDQEAQLAWQANYDVVTGLPNRVLALDRLSQALKAAERSGEYVAVMFVDLDQFKRINDTFGHSCGDELLVRAAANLQQTVRARDTVARFGGDEFVILLDQAQDLVAIEKLAEKVLRAFSTPVTVGEHPLTVTASVGVAVYPQDGQDAETLLSHADAAMYSAKDHGRNCAHFFTAEMNEQAQSRLQLESHLLRALALGEMSVHYQPVVALDSGNVVGAEALLRWHSAHLGFVPPDQFIPLAEDLGFIDELGQWVIDQVLRQYQQWQPLLSAEFRCAINVSPRQFQRGQLADYLLSRLRHYNVPGSAIELEVTEGLMMHNWPTVDAQIEALAQAGVSLSIDDFGTGYSSISYLRKYPFSTLKIDRSFVGELQDDETLVRSVIAMAHSMGLSIIAEGVETPDQYHLLRDAHCCMMQGYLYSRPVPSDAFEALLHNPPPIEPEVSVRRQAAVQV